MAKSTWVWRANGVQVTLSPAEVANNSPDTYETVVLEKLRNQVEMLERAMAGVGAVTALGSFTELKQ